MSFLKDLVSLHVEDQAEWAKNYVMKEDKRFNITDYSVVLEEDRYDVYFYGSYDGITDLLDEQYRDKMIDLHNFLQEKCDGDVNNKAFQEKVDEFMEFIEDDDGLSDGLYDDMLYVFMYICGDQLEKYLQGDTIRVYFNGYQVDEQDVEDFDGLTENIFVIPELSIDLDGLNRDAILDYVVNY